MAAQHPFQVLSASNFDPTNPAYKKRPVHKKTRAGCLSCKAKKVKCDEAKPACRRCQRNRWPCSYDARAAYPSPSTSSTADNGSHDEESLDEELRNQGTPVADLLRHMDTHWADIFPMPQSDTIRQLAEDKPLIQAPLLAITASHLLHLNPKDVHHLVAGHLQQARAIEECTKVLGTPPSALGQSGVNMLLLGSVLINFMTFTIPIAPEPEDDDNNAPSQSDALTRCSWTFAPQPDRPDLIGLQQSLRHFMTAIVLYVDPASTLATLGGILLGDPGATWAFAAINYGLSIVPGHWVRFLHLTELEDSGFILPVARDDDDEPLRFPAIMLAFLRTLGPAPHNVLQMQQFLGKMPPHFRQLLRARDERAVWLLGYWLGLMCRFKGLWWFEQRVHGDYAAVCAWLASRPLDGRPAEERYLWGKMMLDLRSVAS